VSAFQGEIMTNKIVCETNNILKDSKPFIVPVQIPNTNNIGFCLHNFNIEEPVDAYTPHEMLAIRDAIEKAINENCKPSDIKGQTFLWDYDFISLTKPDSEV
jgi:hypothetical protein